MTMQRSETPRTETAGSPAALPVVEKPVGLVRAHGEVDRAALEICDYLMVQAMARTGSLVLDLSEVTRVELAAVPLLVSRMRMVRQAGGELAVCAPRREVRNVLRAGAGSDLPVFATVDEAMAWVRAPQAVVAVAARAAVRAR